MKYRTPSPALLVTIAIAAVCAAGAADRTKRANESTSPVRASHQTTLESAAASALSVCSLQDPDRPNLMPELIGSKADWLNSGPLRLSDLKGKIVLIDFFEYTCVNCLRTLPYLKEWNKRYAKDGLVIIGIHTPEFEFAKSYKNVEAAAKRLGISWPVLIDNDNANWNAYHNSYWPRKYFVDSKGRIIADHAGEGDYDESETTIQTLLKQIHPNLQFPKAMSAVRDSDTAGAVCYPMTAEMYAANTAQHGNLNTYNLETNTRYKDTDGPHKDGLLYLSGEWLPEKQSVRHARETQEPVDYAVIRYHAIEANAVIKPEGGASFMVIVTQDGQSVSKNDAGVDIKYEDSGASYILVDSARMYNLTKNAEFGSHELKLSTASPHFGLYSFTFTSCQEK